MEISNNDSSGEGGGGHLFAAAMLLRAQVVDDNSSDLMNPGGEEPPDEFLSKQTYSHKDIIQQIWLYSGPIIFIVGMTGNALILAVMTRRPMAGTSTSVHLCILAAADLVVLLIGLVPEWFEIGFEAKFKELHPVTCKLEKFLFYTSADTSIWILVIFTLDRLIAIGFPLRKKSICVASRARLFGLVAFLAAVVKNVHVFWTRGSEFQTPKGAAGGASNSTTAAATVLKSNCGKPTVEYAYFESFVRPWIVFATVNVVPFVVILCCNVYIVRALFNVRRLSTVRSLVAPSSATNDRSMVQMTAMCLSASFCFLVCITPSIVLVVGRPYWADTKPYDVAKGISNVIVYVNHSVNVFLYCVTGRRFRRVLVTHVFRPWNSDGFYGDSTFVEGGGGGVTQGTFLPRSGARKSSAGLIVFQNMESRRPSGSDSPAIHGRGGSPFLMPRSDVSSRRPSRVHRL